MITGMKDKIVALIICFFFGGLGIHQFYLGNTSKGVLYLLFCWTFIPTIISWIDFVIILLMDGNKFNRKYNSHYFQGRMFNISTYK